MTLVLAIDTASSALAVACGESPDDVREESFEAAQDHSRTLLPAIDRVLAGRRPELIAVASGPGSYAGLRVGIATAEALALSLSVPVVGIPTLEAAAAATGRDRVTAIHPAGRGEFARQEFSDGEALGPAELASPPMPSPGTLAGEGAGAFGGTEISPANRCRAILAVATTRDDLPVTPIYIREPSITRPRRSPAGASTT